jgi:hypothetical protein
MYHGLGEAGPLDLVGGLLGSAISGAFGFFASKAVAKTQARTAQQAALLGAQAQVEAAQAGRLAAVSFVPALVGIVGLLALVALLRK